jgi:hypothetical protein
MAADESLKPEDLRAQIQQENIVKNDGKPVAEASDQKTAEDVADRLNRTSIGAKKTAGLLDLWRQRCCEFVNPIAA